MRRQIKEFIQECDTCQINKTEHAKPTSLLSHLPIPRHIWTDISMDFVEGLPHSRGKSVNFVVVDQLSKYSHFIPIKHHYTTSSVVQEFFENVF